MNRENSIPFSKLDTSEQATFLLDVLKRSSNQIPWDKVRKYCSSSYAGGLWTRGDRTTWDTKYELSVVSAVAHRLAWDEKALEPFTEFLGWVAAGNASEETLHSIGILLVQENALSKQIKQAVVKKLSDLVEEDWQTYTDGGTPSYASVLFKKFRTWVTGDKQVVEKANEMYAASAFMHSEHGVYEIAERVLHFVKTPTNAGVEAFIRLHVLRRLFDMQKEKIVPDVISAASDLNYEVDAIFAKCSRVDEEIPGSYRSTIGIELQYEGDERLGLKRIRGAEGDIRGRAYYVTKFSMKAINRVVEFAGFESNCDEYYEFSLPPSFGPGVQSLMFLELEKIQHHLVGFETPPEVSLQPSLGDVRYVRGVYDEPQDMQLILLCAGIGFRSCEFSSDQADVTWGKVANMGGVYKGGTMVYERPNEEIKEVDDHVPGVVSEQRMPVVHSFAEGARLVQYESDFSMLMRAAQYKKMGYALTLTGEQFAAAWERFRSQVDGVFAGHGLVFDGLAYDRNERAVAGWLVARELKAHKPSLVKELRQLLVDTRRDALVIERMGIERSELFFENKSDPR